MILQSLAASNTDTENKEGILTTCEKEAQLVPGSSDWNCDLQINSQAGQGSRQEGEG